jgi:hypothetical protein
MEKLQTGTLGQKPFENTGDVLVLSKSLPCGPFSYIDKQKNKYDDSRPPPVYLNINDLNKPRKFGLSEVETDFKIRESGELKLINETLKEKQKGVISDVLKKLTSLLLEGKSFVNLSLPIRIFEPRAQSERMCDSLHFFPYYLEVAAQTTDPVERIKLILTPLFATFHHCLSQYKPFNPLLGETYQGTIGPRTEIYLEHISHYPPINAYYIVNPLFKIYGKWTFDAKFGTNKFETINHGFMTVEFHDGMKIKCNLPIGQINGTLVGDRTFKFIHSFFAFEEISQTKGVITFSDGKSKNGFFSNMFAKGGRIDVVQGQVYIYDRALHEKQLAQSWHSMLKQASKMSDSLKTISTISGSWLNELRFDDKVYWNLARDTKNSHEQKFVANPLPSDLRFREDLIWLFYGNEKYAQQWKLVVEASQRGNKEKREEVKKLQGKS